MSGHQSLTITWASDCTLTYQKGFNIHNKKHNEQTYMFLVNSYPDRLVPGKYTHTPNGEENSLPVTTCLYMS